MKENFSLQHTVLYAKQWYKQSDDLWTDLRPCLKADNYNGDCMEKGDFVTVLLHQVERLKNPRYSDLLTVLNDIRDVNCWRYGYITSTNNSSKQDKYKPYDWHEAVVRYCLSVFRFLDNEEWTPISPDYKNVLPMPSNITNEDVDRMFGDLKK